MHWLHPTKEEYGERLERVSHGGGASQAGRQAAVRTNSLCPSWARTDSQHLAVTYGFGFLMTWLSTPVPRTSACKRKNEVALDVSNPVEFLQKRRNWIPILRISCGHSCVPNAKDRNFSCANSIPPFFLRFSHKPKEPDILLCYWFPPTATIISVIDHALASNFMVKHPLFFDFWRSCKQLLLSETHVDLFHHIALGCSFWYMLFWNNE